MTTKATSYKAAFIFLDNLISFIPPSTAPESLPHFSSPKIDTEHYSPKRNIPQ